MRVPYLLSRPHASTGQKTIRSTFLPSFKTFQTASYLERKMTFIPCVAKTFSTSFQILWVRTPSTQPRADPIPCPRSWRTNEASARNKTTESNSVSMWNFTALLPSRHWYVAPHLRELLDLCTNPFNLFVFIFDIFWILHRFFFFHMGLLVRYVIQKMCSVSIRILFENCSWSVSILTYFCRYRLTWFILFNFLLRIILSFICAAGRNATSTIFNKKKDVDQQKKNSW